MNPGSTVLPAQHYRRERWRNGAGWTRVIVRLRFAGEYEVFADAMTGQPIIGYSWQQSLAASTAQLAQLLSGARQAPAVAPCPVAE